MQKLSPEMMDGHEPESMDSDYIPAIEVAEFYFALVNYKGKRVLCILDESDKWRPTSYQEMMHLMR